MKLKKNVTYQNQECDKYGIFLLSAPHAWGWFLTLRKERERDEVCPTCVGMVPDHYRTFSEIIRLPHMRGDGSPLFREVPVTCRSAPHAWGWFGGEL